LDAQLSQIFASEGPLVQSLKGFEVRPGQQEMARQILHAYLEDYIALIEAGTGTGKSLAYLIPAILWALKNKEKTVISTYTIALQEQLLEKDIPKVLKALNVDLKATIVKGMGNYLCLRRLHEIEDQDLEIERVHAWAERTREGSYSDIPFALPSASWDRVNADSQSCSHVHCPHYKECFFFKARRQAEDSQLLIVNHHILFADLAARKRKDFKEEKSIIPAFKRIVVDEAHHLEDVALDALSKRSDRLNLVRLLGRIHSDLHPERSRLTAIRQAIKEPISSLIPCLEIDLPHAKRELAAKIEEAFHSLEAFCRSVFNSKEARWRFRPEHFEHPLLQSEVIPLFNLVVDLLKKFVQSLQALKEEVEKDMAQHAIELQAVAIRLEEQAEILLSFFEKMYQETRVRWVEMSATGTNLTLVDAQLDISSYLKGEFFTPLSTVALCSATLSCAGAFSHLRRTLGISEDLRTSEKIYESPFDYPSHALLAISRDMPDPSDFSFTERATEYIVQSLRVTRGGAFVLFTSYEMLRAVHQSLQGIAVKEGWYLLKQGDASRSLLVEQFKKQKQSVLFGTDSFWEGVDIPGETLRLVIIVKLPFRVPSDPLMQAMSEVLEKSGKNAFMEYQVPQAVLKFKQGFGRLIRSKTDKGTILCLDKRLCTKPYGKLFFNSLPPSQIIFGDREEIHRAMETMR
jgi:ATP-dependent DNA helicase DinG